MPGEENGQFLFGWLESHGHRRLTWEGRVPHLCPHCCTPVRKLRKGWEAVKKIPDWQRLGGSQVLRPAEKEQGAIRIRARR